MKSALTVRPAEAPDVVVVTGLVGSLMRELGSSCFDATGLHETYEALMLGERGDFVLLAEVGNSVVGICSVSGVWALRAEGRYGIVQEMFILPSFRRQGIGAQLLASALERARAGGFSMLEVGTPPEGARQGRFYARAGFLRFGDRWRFAFPRPQPASIS